MSNNNKENIDGENLHNNINGIIVDYDEENDDNGLMVNDTSFVVRGQIVPRRHGQRNRLLYDQLSYWCISHDCISDDSVAALDRQQVEHAAVTMLMSNCHDNDDAAISGGCRNCMLVEHANEMLKGLDYFKEERQINSVNVSDDVNKSAFNWAATVGDDKDNNRVSMRNMAKCILHLCLEVKKLVSAEPRCLEISQPCYIMGDLHGKLEDLLAFQQDFWPRGPENCPSNLLFLGDFVDRGAYSVEVVCYLFAQKIRSPENVFLVRGNHEERLVQRQMDIIGFEYECKVKFGANDGLIVWDAINDVFDCLPLAAIVADKIFCMHGGIPQPHLLTAAGGDLKASINAIRCPLRSIEPHSEALCYQLLWNDPVWDDARSRLDSSGFGPNWLRKNDAVKVFSKRALFEFLNRHRLSQVVRAHAVFGHHGFNVRYNARLLTVFSSSIYPGHSEENEACCLSVIRNRITIHPIGHHQFNQRHRKMFRGFKPPPPPTSSGGSSSSHGSSKSSLKRPHRSSSSER